MGGVDLSDLSDQKRKTLYCSRKSIKWYMRLFWFVVDIYVVNAHIIEQKSHHHKKRTQKAFRLALGSELLKVANARKRQGRPRKSPAAVRLTERHFAEKTENRRRCIVCAKKKNVEKRTFFQCSTCNVTLYPDECFQLFHTKDMYWK